jgi:hypothetical protein
MRTSICAEDSMDFQGAGSGQIRDAFTTIAHPGTDVTYAIN